MTGPDSVVIVGGFDWTTDKAIEHYSYTGLLRRRDGQWRIRLEDETQAGATPPRADLRWRHAAVTSPAQQFG